MPETAISPSELVTSGAVVSASNPLPVTLVLVPPAPVAAEAVSPRVFVVNGELVSPTNPLPVYIL